MWKVKNVINNDVIKICLEFDILKVIFNVFPNITVRYTEPAVYQTQAKHAIVNQARKIIFVRPTGIVYADEKD